MLRAFELMHQGKMNGYFCQGFNPLLSFPNRAKMHGGAVEAEVPGDRWTRCETETARFWENHGEFNDVDPAAIQTEVIQLPTTCFAEDEGSLTNSGRWLQWHWPGGTPPGEAKTDIWIMAQIFLRLKALYREGGRRLPRPDPQSALALCGPGRADSRRSSPRRSTATRSTTLTDPTDPTKVAGRGGQAGRRASPQLRDDGTTACGCWIYSGCFTENGNNMARRDNDRSRTTPAPTPNWAFSWPVNRRILYNRASAT